MVEQRAAGTVVPGRGQRYDPPMAGTVEHRGDDAELLGPRRVVADVNPDRPDRRDVADAEARRDRARTADDAAERGEPANVAGSDDAPIDEHGPKEVAQVGAERQ